MVGNRRPAHAGPCYDRLVAAHGFALFDTAIGRCGVGWSERGVVAVQLPEAHEHLTRKRLSRELADPREAIPPNYIQLAIEAIAALLRGEPIDLSTVALDLEDVPPFNRRVYEVARTIPPGSTLSYGEIAARLGEPQAARAVGQALGQNPIPIIVPCHRVLAAGRRMGGFSAPGGAATKFRLLAIEGAAAGFQPNLFDRATSQ